MTAMRPLVIGVGNAYRRDDGAGIAVVEALRRLGAGVDIATAGGEPAALLDCWTGRSLVLLVDATRSGAPAGTVHRIEVNGSGTEGLPAPAVTPSGHRLGVTEAVALGRALQRLPHRLVVFAIEAGDDSFGVGLSGPVAAAVDSVVNAVLHEARSNGEAQS